MGAISTGVMLSSAAAACWFGYEAYHYEEPAYGILQAPEPVAAVFLPDQPDDAGWELLGKDVVRILLLQQTVFGLPAEQSDNTVLAMEFGSVALAIGLGKALVHTDVVEASLDLGSSVLDFGSDVIGFVD